MIKKLFFILSVGIWGLPANGQDFASYIRNNAVRTDSLATSNNQVYNLLSGFKLIMIGEMHGTNEPAKLVTQLADIFTSHNDSVQIGLEIPAQLMNQYLNNQTDENIYTSDFFAKSSQDGRASHAWAEIISKLNQDSKVKIFFYDIDSNESVVSRDSLMYLKIKKQIKLFPHWKTITLSGNIHNMILPYRDTPRMALYLMKDEELNISKKTCSLNHFYQSGTMLNNTGNGLKMREINNGPSIYSQSLDFYSYLLLFPENHTERYNGIYFTRTVSAAKMVSH
ncbi:hypothetical protein [Runella limosa]|uniref:hypothetical protein n=1 Tax=Runella limosa TaxID=370978 RepID=UPI00040AC323|nr:hypothetical protein [Runella limosa]